jgi:hypothetical protein
LQSLQARSLQNVAHKFSYNLSTQLPHLPLSSRRWSAAGVVVVVGGGQQWTTVSTAMNGDSRQPPPPLTLGVERQSLADNGQWPAEGWWEAELFTNKIMGVSR